MGMKQIFFFFFEKQKQNGQRKKLKFSIPLILKTFSRKFLGLVLGLVGLIDAQGIDVALPKIYGCF